MPYVSSTPWALSASIFDVHAYLSHCTPQFGIVLLLVGLVATSALRLGHHTRSTVEKHFATALGRLKSKASSASALDVANNPDEVAQCVNLAGSMLYGNPDALTMQPFLGAICLRSHVPAHAKLLAERAMMQFQVDGLAAATFSSGVTVNRDMVGMASMPANPGTCRRDISLPRLPEGPLSIVLSFVYDKSQRANLRRAYYGHINNTVLLTQVPSPVRGAGPLNEGPKPLWDCGDALLLSHFALNNLLNAARGPAVGGVRRPRSNDGSGVDGQFYGPKLEDLLMRSADDAARMQGFGTVALQLEPRRSAAHIIVSPDHVALLFFFNFSIIPMLQWHHSALL